VPCWLDSHVVQGTGYLPNLPSREPWLHYIHYILIYLFFPTDLKSKNLSYVNLMKAKAHAELINLIDSEGMGYALKSEQ